MVRMRMMIKNSVTFFLTYIIRSKYSCTIYWELPYLQMFAQVSSSSLFVQVGKKMTNQSWYAHTRIREHIIKKHVFFGALPELAKPFLTVFSFWRLPWEEEGAEIVLGTVAIPTEAYRRKNSAEKASSARSLSQWNQISTDPLVNANSVLTVTQDHRHLGQIDPNVPVFLENVVFFEAGRRRVLGNGSACTRRLLPTSREPRRRTILWLSTAFMKYLPEI